MIRVLRYAMAVLRSIGCKVAVNGSVAWTGRWIATSARIIIRRGGKILLGRNARIGEYTRVIVGPGSVLAIGPRTAIERGGELTAVYGARVAIGADTYVGSFCNIRSDDSIQIGNGCYIAQFVSVIDGGYKLTAETGRISREDYETKSVRIGHNVWLGVGVIVLPGVSIGDGAVLGAGAVVTKDIPARSIAVGNPARVTSVRP